MRVFNLLETSLDFRGRIIQPGKSLDFPELDEFIPDRDRQLEARGIIAFRELPRGWGRPTPVPGPLHVIEMPTPPPLVIEAVVPDEWVEEPIGKKHRRK